MTTSPDDAETPVEREDGPDPTDVPQGDAAGRVDDEDLGGGSEGADSPLLGLGDGEGSS